MPLVEGFMDFSTFRIFKDELMNKFVDPEELVSAEYDDEPSKKTATVVVAKPNLFTKALEKKIRDISNYDRVFVFCLPNEESPFTHDIVRSQVDAYNSSCKDVMSCHFCIDEDELRSKMSEVEGEYEIETVCTTTDLSPWLKDLIGKDVGDIGYIEDETRAMEYILKDDFSRFKSICPTYISSMYMALQSELEKTQKIDYQT